MFDMNEKLQDRCSRQIENERIIRQTVKLESEESVKLGALLYTAMGLTVDPEKILSCRQILRNKTGAFSNFRGTLQFVILLKMTLAEDPEDYIDQVIAVYDKLTANIVLPGMIYVMVAVTLYEKSGDRDMDALIAEVLNIYNMVKKLHPYLTDEADMGYITLMVLAGKATEEVEEEKESIYLELKNQYQMTAETAQAIALVLLTSSKPAKEKVEQLLCLYESLKEEKHATGKNKFMSIYGAFTDLKAPQEETTALICDADRYLKEQKGSGVFAINSDLRKVIASTLVLQFYTVDKPSWPEDASAEVSVDALLFTIIMSLMVTI